MGKLTCKDDVRILTTWALMLVCVAAEQEYFTQTTDLSWTEARNHCQICYKDLVTLTPENIQNITLKLSSDHWVGLRKNFTSSSSVSWSRWANGDPLAFQNWYPGWPVFKSPPAKTQCCSCSCTCPAEVTPGAPASTLDFTTQNVTGASKGPTAETTATPAPALTHARGDVVAECERSPMLPPEVPDTDENYIEDSCVAMLSFGAWVERNCTEHLPFICYDDRFSGNVTVTQMTSTTADIAWLPGPNNTSHYRVVVNKKAEDNVTDLSYGLVNLTAGGHYSVQVFPVKCMRDLNPLKISFYTPPNRVENLTATQATENLISLSWNKPDGNVDFYLVEVQGVKSKIKAESREIDDLIPGHLYTITVRSGVGDSTLSEESSIEQYTKPGKVSNLMASDNAEDSLLLTWTPPAGDTTGYWVKAFNSRNKTSLYDKKVNQAAERVTDLPVGTEITLSVTALANYTLEGETVTIVSYTAPEPVSNLALVTTSHSLTAHWESVGFSNFTVTLLLDGETVENCTVTKTSKTFHRLKTATNYTVTVSSVSGNGISQPEQDSAFTLPLMPTDVKVTNSDFNQISLKWNAPDNTNASYLVSINSSFWGQSWFVNVDNQNKHTFNNLTSGTRYTIGVQTKAGEFLSEAAILSQSTDADKVEIGLSMMCSSTESLLCDRSDTREAVFRQLHEHFNNLLQDSIFWDLQRQEIDN